MSGGAEQTQAGEASGGDSGEARPGPGSWLLVTLLAGVPLLSSLGTAPYWGDEWYTVDAISRGWGDLVAHIARNDCHPPLYYLWAKAWVEGFAGLGLATVPYPPEWMLRLPSALATIAAVLVTAWFLQREVPGRPSLPLLLIGLCLPASTVIVFGKMGRYFGLIALLYALGLVCLHRGIREGAARWFAGLGLLNLASLYTFYLLPLCALPSQGLILWGGLPGEPERRRRMVLGFAAAWVLPGLAFLPYLPYLLAGLGAPGPAAELGGGSLLVGFFSKLGYTLLAFLVGVSVFPWRIWVSGPAFLLGAWLAWRGSRHLWREQPEGARVVLVGAVVPVVLAALLLPFLLKRLFVLNYPVRVFFAAPWIWAILAMGVLSPATPRGRVAALAGLLLLHGLSFWNLQRFQDLHHYIPPVRELGSMIRSATDSVCLSIDNNLRPYTGDRFLPLDATGSFDVGGRRDVWIFNSARREADQNPDIRRLNEFEGTLASQGFALTGEWWVCPEDELTRTIKRRLSGREVFPYKMVLRRFQRPSE